MSTLKTVVEFVARVSDEGLDVPAAWRAARIMSASEVLEWVEAGVFDGYRAGLLKATGIEPSDLLELRHGNLPLGFSYAIGNVGVEEVVDVVRSGNLTRTG